MKFNKNITYYCYNCSSYTSTLHEIIYGSLYRQISIKHSVQLPLCTVCHHEAHHSYKRQEMMQEMLKYLGTKYHDIIKAYNDKNKRHLLEEGHEERVKKIRGLEV